MPIRKLRWEREATRHNDSSSNARDYGWKPEHALALIILWRSSLHF
jgi:hypothetical protein